MDKIRSRSQFRAIDQCQERNCAKYVLLLAIVQRGACQQRVDEAPVNMGVACIDGWKQILSHVFEQMVDPVWLQARLSRLNMLLQTHGLKRRHKAEQGSFVLPKLAHG